jgi:transposase
MGRKGKRTAGQEETHPFMGMSQVNPNASGVDLSVMDGFGVLLSQTVIKEVGTDMSKIPSETHFCLWLGLAPKHEISDGKVLNKARYLIM